LPGENKKKKKRRERVSVSECGSSQIWHEILKTTHAYTFTFQRALTSNTPISFRDSPFTLSLSSNFNPNQKTILFPLGFLLPLGLPIPFSFWSPSPNMATETLEENKPPLRDDDDLAKPQPGPEIPDKDASEDVAKSEDANVEEKDGTFDQGVEEEEAPEKKEEIDEDEDDDEEEEDDEVEEKEEVKVKGRSKETPDKSSKKSKKNAALEKKDPVTPVSERPTRERKTVERFSVPSPAKSGRSSASKGLTIEKV